MQERLLDVHRALEPVALNPASNRLYARLEQARGGGALAERLAHRIRLGRGTGLQFLVGAPGSGKSTELRRVQRELVRGDEVPHTVLFLDLAPDLDPRDVHLADIAWPLAAALLRATLPLAHDLPAVAAAAREFEAVATDLLGGGPEALRQPAGNGSAVPADLVEADDTAEDAHPAPRLQRALRHDPELRAAWRAAFARRAHRWTEALRRLAACAREALAAPASRLVLLLDGLDHLDRWEAPGDTPSPWRGLLAALERLLAEFPCDVVVAAPYAALLGGRTAPLRATTATAVELLPFARLRRRDGGEEERARARMAEILTRRLRALELEPDDVLLPAARARLVEASAGSPRQLLRLAHRATLEAALPLTLEHAEAACADARRHFFDLVREDHRPLLEHTQLYYELNDLPDHVALHAELFRFGALLCYFENDEVWYGINPLLHERVI